LQNEDRRAVSIRSFARCVAMSLVCSFVASCGPSAPTADPNAPSVILISLDTCRADLFGALTGEEPSRTPSLDRFAADAVTFDHAFVQAPHTLPSHMSMMTSVYPDVHGVKPDRDPLSESFVTLPEILHGAGYRTVGLVTSEWLKPEFGFGRGFDVYERLPHERTYADRVNTEALRQIERHRLPFFLFLHYYDLHSDFEHGRVGNKLPYYSSPAARERLGISADGQEFCDGEGQCNTRYLMAMDRERQPLSPARIHLIHDLYRAAVPELDAEMGKFFDALKRQGLYDDALIVVTSDHGEEFREHGRFIHSQPYDETTHVPLFIKFPHSRKAGTRVSRVVETVDLMPTLLEALKLDVPDGVQGESLLDLLGDGRTWTKDAVLSEDSITWTRYGLRTDGVKLIMDLKTGHRELYDLAADPGETTNLADERPDLADEMEGRLERLVRANRRLGRAFADGTVSGKDVLSGEERKRLESLGYVN